MSGVGPALGLGLYEEVLAAGGAALVAPKPPRGSASVVLWRDAGGGAGVEVYWLERGVELPFMGGWRAFPGGALDRRDAATEVHGEPVGASSSSRTPASSDPSEQPTEPDLVPGLAACALRELAEECRVELAANGRPDASRLVFAGRWLTPPFTPVRFDNRFFLARWRPGDGEPFAVPPESASGEWIRPADALAGLDAGSPLAAPPIVHVLRVLSEHSPDDPAALARLRDTSEANLGPLRRIELRPGLLLFPQRTATLPPATHTNTFLLGTGDCALVDPGSADPGENERLLAALAAARERLGRRVVGVWLTHHHPDHVAGAAFFRDALGVPVVAHPATAERLAARGLSVDLAFEGGETFELAGEPSFAVRVHATPGHARGHLAFEVGLGGGSASDLVAGDLVAGFGTIVIDPPEGNMTDYLGSLERLEAVRARTLFVSHGAPFVDATAKLAAYRAHRLEREAQVVAALADGLRSPEAMLPRIYPEVPEAIRPLAARQVRAHLERLAALGSPAAREAFEAR